jgi:hypothetical protein
MSFESICLERRFVNKRSNRVRFSNGHAPSRMDLYGNGGWRHNTRTTSRTSSNDANPDEDQSESTATPRSTPNLADGFEKKVLSHQQKNTVERSLSPQCAGILIRAKVWQLSLLYRCVSDTHHGAICPNHSQPPRLSSGKSFTREDWIKTRPE